MNVYLDREVQQAIRDKIVRFDDDLTGKVVKESTYGNANIVGITFTDGTWCAAIADDAGCGEEPEIHHICGYSNMDLFDLADLGLITEEQFQEADAKRKEAERSFKQSEIDRLQKELECG